MFCLAFFNFFGATITKNLSSLARAVIEICRTCLVWLVGIIVTLSCDSVKCKWETLNAVPILIELIGFSLIIMGNLIY